LLLLLATLTVIPSISAHGEPVNIFPYIDGAVYEIQTDQEAHIFLAWIALSPGLVQEYLNASHESYTLVGNGETVVVSEAEIEQAYGSIIQAPPEVVGVECPRPLVAGAILDYNLGHLQPGTYTLTRMVTLDHPVNDAFHVCTFAGQPAANTPSLFEGTRVSTVTIIVAE
jgi:hypothetical protein